MLNVQPALLQPALLITVGTVGRALRRFKLSDADWLLASDVGSAVPESQYQHSSEAHQAALLLQVYCAVCCGSDCGVGVAVEGDGRGKAQQNLQTPPGGARQGGLISYAGLKFASLF